MIIFAKPITDVELKTLLRTHPQTLLIDVRTQEERDQGHLGGIFCPLDSLAKNHPDLGEIPLQTPIVIYCRSGNRSKKGAQLLGALYPKREIFYLSSPIKNLL